MLSILKYFKKRNIDTSYIIIYSVSLLVLGYIFGIINISLLIAIDIYIFLYLTFFKINTRFINKNSVVKIDITQEGVQKEEINMESLIKDYSKKFSSK